MATYDVRGEAANIDEIIFANPSETGGSYQACKLVKQHDGDAKLYDGSEDYVYVNSEEHARNLIKALEKAIELGWLK